MRHGDVNRKEHVAFLPAANKLFRVQTFIAVSLIIHNR